MGSLGNLAGKGKEKAKTKAKSAVKKAVLGDDEFVCTHCGRTRNRTQVQHYGSKTKKPPTWTCKNFRDCQKAQGSHKVKRRSLKGNEGWWEE